ncbi:MAG: tetratricopeptide repeat protein [Planctomycetes bacterium]|nr:tetratricopeptide repeat protein [Planctomycetota bacterium]
MSSPKRKPAEFPAVIFILCIAFSAVSVLAQLRNVKVGDKMPEFSLAVPPAPNEPNEPNEPNTAMFTYKRNRGRVLGLVFLSASQKQSQRAVDDIEKIVTELGQQDTAFDFIGVMSEPPERKSVESGKEESAYVLPILPDEKYKLWGKLGIIATPTVLVVEKDGLISWIKAGYGYDFAPSLRTHLNYALGITSEKVGDELTKVQVLTGDSVQAKVRRHLTIAKMLEKKGRFESAIAEARKAKDLDPNSIDAVLAIGELFCRTGQSEKALDVVGKIKATRRIDRAQILLISGWAKRQLGDFDSAEKILLEMVAIHPQSSRAFYELGKVYQAREQTEKAMRAYRRALSIIFAEPVKTVFSQ